MKAASHRPPLPEGLIPGTPYRIRQLLAEGGFSLVYLADGPSGRVVVKELFDSGRCRRRAGGQQLEPLDGQAAIHERQKLRCREEWARFKGFHHPNIVRLQDFFELNNTCYTVMPFVDGESLLERVLRKPLDVSELMSLIRPLAGALDALHLQFVVHRDVKPDNIWLRASDGQPLLLDTGAARSVEGSRRGGTRLLTMLGAPELRGQAETNRYGQVGPATDVFALAGVCGFALTGQEPPDPTLRDLAPGQDDTLLQQWKLPVQDAVAAVIRRGLALKVAARLQSPGAFAVALEQAYRQAPPDLAKVTTKTGPEPTVASGRPKRPSLLDWLPSSIAIAALAAAAALMTPEEPLLGIALFLVGHMATVIFCANRRARWGQALTPMDILPVANLVLISKTPRRVSK